MTAAGGRTEDMKLFHIDFDEMIRTDITDEDGTVRPMEFEDSELYSYFTDHEFLCVIFQEPLIRTVNVGSAKIKARPNSLSANTFVGFKRLVFSDEFIYGPVRQLWEDIRNKVMNGILVDIIQRRRDGSVVTISSGEVSSAPNFMKSSENDVFVRGSGVDSSSRYKTECVNGIRMLPQYVWLKGFAVVDELRGTPEL